MSILKRKVLQQRRRGGSALGDPHGARFYSTVLGRFLSPDPLVGGSGPLIVNLALSSVQGLNMPAKFGSLAMSRAPNNPQSLDRYSYAMNNPLRYTDPTGLFASEGEEVFWKFLHTLVDWGYSGAEINRLLRPNCCGGTGYEAAEKARSMIGVPYQMVNDADGRADRNQDGRPDYLDCSGLVVNVYAELGLLTRGGDIRTAQQLFEWAGTGSNSKDRSDLLPGDLVFYTDTYDTTDYVSHVAIYEGGGMLVVADEPRGPGTGSVREVPLDGYLRTKLVGYGRPRY